MIRPNVFQYWRNIRVIVYCCVALFQFSLRHYLGLVTMWFIFVGISRKVDNILIENWDHQNIIPYVTPTIQRFYGILCFRDFDSFDWLIHVPPVQQIRNFLSPNQRSERDLGFCENTHLLKLKIYCTYVQYLYYSSSTLNAFITNNCYSSSVILWARDGSILLTSTGGGNRVPV